MLVIKYTMPAGDYLAGLLNLIISGVKGSGGKII
jgi:hypothetical protein